MRSPRPVGSSGFTLLELVVVVVVLAVLAAIAIPTFAAVVTRTKDERTLIELHGVSREAAALAALSDGDASDSETALSWLAAGSGSDSGSAAAPGAYAAPGSARSVARLSGRDLPVLSLPAVDLPGVSLSAADLSVLLEVLDAPSEEYGFFSVGLGSASDDVVGAAMRSLHSGHCVYATYAPGGGVLETAVTDWSPSCRGSNAAGAIADPDGDVLAVAPDVATTLFNTPVDVDVLANDGEGASLVSASPSASGGTVVVVGGRLSYTPGPNFVGVDTFTYRASTPAGTGTGTVTVTVTSECAGVLTVPVVWLPTGLPTSSECETPDGPGTGPTGPVDPPVTTISDPLLPPTPPVSVDPVGGNVTALTSFPHSDSAFPHYVFGATQTGGLMWVKDTGVSGVQSAGCATPGETPGAGLCASGWLFPAGTFSSPSAALTGNGPGHGSVPAEFSYDTIFVADSAGLWLSHVSGFTRAAAPKLLTSLPGTTVSLTGYACFDGATKVAGSCIWALGTAGSELFLTRVDVASGAKRTFTLDRGVLGAVNLVQAISHQGVPQLLVGDQDSNFQRYSTSGLLEGPAATSPGAVGPKMVFGPDVYTLDGLGLRSAPIPTGGEYVYPRDVAPRTAGSTMVALHSHGVAAQVYMSGSDSCVYKTTGSSWSTLWCGNGGMATATSTAAPVVPDVPATWVWTKNAAPFSLVSVDGPSYRASSGVVRAVVSSGTADWPSSGGYYTKSEANLYCVELATGLRSRSSYSTDWVPLSADGRTRSMTFDLAVVCGPGHGFDALRVNVDGDYYGTVGTWYPQGHLARPGAPAVNYVPDGNPQSAGWKHTLNTPEYYRVLHLEAPAHRARTGSVRMVVESWEWGRWPSAGGYYSDSVVRLNCVNLADGSLWQRERVTSWTPIAGNGGVRSIAVDVSVCGPGYAFDSVWMDVREQPSAVVGVTGTWYPQGHRLRPGAAPIVHFPNGNPQPAGWVYTKRTDPFKVLHVQAPAHRATSGSLRVAISAGGWAAPWPSAGGYYTSSDLVLRCVSLTTGSVREHRSVVWTPVAGDGGTRYATVDVASNCGAGFGFDSFRVDVDDDYGSGIIGAWYPVGHPSRPA